jgi:hypothetical protein
VTPISARPAQAPRREKVMNASFPYRRLARPSALALALAFLLAAFLTPQQAQADFISISATLHNDGDLPLRLVSWKLEHGCWEQMAPDTVAPHSTVTWRSASCDLSILTGTEGHVEYAPYGTANTVHASFSWNIPTVGDNEGGHAGPSGCTTSHDGPPKDGNNVSVTYRMACGTSSDDGIPDVWKLNGASWNVNGTTVFVDLKAMGAVVGQRDLFVQLDWMQNATNNQKLRPQAIKNVVDAFAANGIRLHVDHGPDSIRDFATNATWGSLSQAKARAYQANFGITGLDGAGKLTYDWSALKAVKALPDGFDNLGRSGIFHYAIAVAQLGNAPNSGIGRTAGTDFIIALGTFTGGVGSLEEQTGTFMHELGHNLKLEHGGGDDFNFKPNYPSVMNYAFQLRGVIKNGAAGTWDYSHGREAPFAENAFNESTGLGPSAAGFGTLHFCPAAGGSPAVRIPVLNANGPVDWNCDGDTADQSPPSPGFDVNADPNDPANTLSTMTDFDDWGRLKLKNGSIGSFGAPLPPEPSVTRLESITSVQAQQIVAIDTDAPVTTAQAAPPPNAAGWNNTNVTVTLTATDNPGGSGVARIEYNLDGTGWQTYTAPVTIATDGIHTVQYRAIDRATNQESPKSLTVKLDKTPPTVACSVNPSSLWPPNHKLVDVTATVTVTDAGSGQAGFVLVSVASNEPDNGQGDGDTAGDVQGFALTTADTTGQVRAERSGGGSGRIYTLTYRGMDIAGNTATCNTTVTVDHNQGR